MDRTEFAQILAVMAAATGREIPREQAEAYYLLLGDLSAEAATQGTVRAVMELQDNFLPPAGLIRRYAEEPTVRMTAGEAFETARKAIRRYGYYRPEDGIRSLPADVASVVRQIGWRDWCDTENIESLRARFCQFWDAMGKKTASASAAESAARICGGSQSKLILDAAARVGRDVPKVEAKGQQHGKATNNSSGVRHGELRGSGGPNRTPVRQGRDHAGRG